MAVRSIALIVSVYGAPELPRALSATAPMIRSKPPLAGALGASSATMLPLWAVASSVSVASLAFTGMWLRPFVAAAGARLAPSRWLSAAGSTVGGGEDVHQTL